MYNLRTDSGSMRLAYRDFDLHGLNQFTIQELILIWNKLQYLFSSHKLKDAVSQS
jgi:hypothetical protein